MVFLKEAAKELKASYQATGAPVKVTFFAPDGTKILEQQTTNAPVTLAVPADGVPGIYRLVLEGENYKFSGRIETAGRFMVEKTDKDVSLPGPMDWYFLVPKGSKQLKVKCDGLIFNADMKLMKAPQNGVLGVPADQAGRLWRFRPFPQGCGGNLAYLSLEGAQPYIAPHRTYWWDITRTGTNPSSPYYRALVGEEKKPRDEPF